MAKADIVTERVLGKIEPSFVGEDYGYDGYAPSAVGEEIFAIIQKHIRDDLKNAIEDELKTVRTEIRKEFVGVKSENARLKAELEFYKGIEKAALRKHPA